MILFPPARFGTQFDGGVPAVSYIHSCAKPSTDTDNHFNLKTTVKEFTMKSYGEFCSQVFDDSRCDMILGCEATVTKKIGNMTALGTLSLKPRAYPGKDYRRANEEKFPGGCQMLLAGSLSDMPFQISWRNGQPPAVQLTVPVSPELALGIVSKISRQMDFVASMNYNSKFFSSSISANVMNRISSSLIELDAVYSPKPNVGFGFSISHPINTYGRSLSLVAHSVIADLNTSCVFYKSVKSSLAFAVSKSIEPNTTVGASLEAHPDLSSEWRFGFRKRFTLSELSACISNNAVIQSFYQRQLKEGCLMSMSSYTDARNKVFSLGFGITIAE